MGIVFGRAAFLFWESPAQPFYYLWRALYVVVEYPIPYDDDHS